MEWTIIGLLVGVLILELFAIARRSAMAGRIRRLETRVAEIGNQLGDEVAEKVSVESQALREEVVTRLTSLQSCADQMATFETRIEEMVRREPEPLDAESLAGMIRPLIREAVDSIDGRIRNVSDTIREVSEEAPEDAVVRALTDRGFKDVQIVGPAGEDGNRLRLFVEARRDGMTFKGPVFLDGSRVVEQRLSPAYPMFP